MEIASDRRVAVASPDFLIRLVTSPDIVCMSRSTVRPAGIPNRASPERLLTRAEGPAAARTDRSPETVFTSIVPATTADAGVSAGSVETEVATNVVGDNITGGGRHGEVAGHVTELEVAGCSLGFEILGDGFLNAAIPAGGGQDEAAQAGDDQEVPGSGPYAAAGVVRHIDLDVCGRVARRLPLGLLGGRTARSEPCISTM